LDDDAVILALAREHGLTWGEAHWIEVARRLDLPLVTADLRLARAVPDEVAVVVYLGDGQAA
jgi:predicted nucleic acid-binding protein